jgi:hypothetical protein
MNSLELFVFHTNRQTPNFVIVLAFHGQPLSMLKSHYLFAKRRILASLLPVRGRGILSVAPRIFIDPGLLRDARVVRSRL